MSAPIWFRFKRELLALAKANGEGFRPVESDDSDHWAHQQIGLGVERAPVTHEE